MLRLLFDTNVLLDVVLARAPWSTDAIALLAFVEAAQRSASLRRHR